MAKRKEHVPPWEGHGGYFQWVGTEEKGREKRACLNGRAGYSGGIEGVD